MEAPTQNSNALSAREAAGLSEGNGIFDGITTKAVCFTGDQMRSCSPASETGQEIMRAPTKTEVNARCYSSAPGAVRFR